MNAVARARLLLAAILLACVFGSPPCRATGEVAPLGPTTSELLALEATPERFPGADGIILFRGVQVTLFPDGRVSRRVRVVRRLFTDLAIAQGGDPRVAYDTTRQQLDVSVCRTFMRDGTEVSMLRRALNRVTPERVAACPDRASLQEMVISLLGLERGCLTELDYTVSDRVSFHPWLEGREPIGDIDPVLREIVSIETPSEAGLKAAACGLDATPLPESQSVEPGATRKTWTFGPIAANPTEGGRSSLERVSSLVYSTCPSWDALYSWLADQLRGATVADSALLAWTAKPKSSAGEPLDDTERLAHLAWLIGERVKSAEDSPVVFWVSPRPASRTFESSCGNLLDRAALALAVLKAWGISSTVLLRPAVTSVTEEVPSLGQFDDIWIDAGTRRLSVAGGQSSAQPDPGWARVVLGPSSNPSEAGAQFTPLLDRGSHAFLSLDLRNTDKGSVEGEALVRVGGTICRSLAYEDVQGYVKELASTLAVEGKPEGFRVEALGPDTLAVVFNIKGTALGDSLGAGRREYLIPSGPGLPAGAFPQGVDWRRWGRTGSLALPATLDEQVRVRLRPTKSTMVLILPRNQDLEGPGISLEQKAERRDGVIYLERSWRIRARDVSAKDYSLFREIVLHRLEKTGSAVFLQEK
jgi:hypothetical protein